MKQAILDYLWVIVAYIRGKVLRQKAYRPQGAGKVSFLHASRGATGRRMLMLLKLWGCRPASVEELLALQGMRFAIEDELRDLAGCQFVPTIPWSDSRNKPYLVGFDGNGLMLHSASDWDRWHSHDSWGSLGDSCTRLTLRTY